MRLPSRQIGLRSGSARGFTLVELMAAIFISILVIGTLYQVFSRVQGIFRIGNNQAQVLERGRALMDMMVRELEMMSPANLPSIENLSVRDFGVEYWQPGMAFAKGNVAFNPGDRAYFVCQQEHDPSGQANAPGNPQFWRVLNPAEYTAVVDSEKTLRGDFFFIGKDRNWHAFGYGLYSGAGARDPNFLLGALYRFHKPMANWSEIAPVVANHHSRGGAAAYQKVADGVLHLRMRAISAQDIGRALWYEPVLRGDKVPLFVELELALVEDTLAREMEVKGEEFVGTINDRFNKQLELLANNTDRIHFFRQLVPIRNRRSN